MVITLQHGQHVATVRRHKQQARKAHTRDVRARVSDVRLCVRRHLVASNVGRPSGSRGGGERKTQKILKPKN